MTTPTNKANRGPRPSAARVADNITPANGQSTKYHSDQSPSRSNVKKSSHSVSASHLTSPSNQATGPSRKQQSSKKNNYAQQATRNQSNGHDQPQPNVTSPDRRATPLKQAYAGPTFHSSPAASSLPLPSFFAKMPTVKASPPSNPEGQLDGEARLESDHESLKPVSSESLGPSNREPSPLDFMFDAARKARDTPKSQSPAYGMGRLSPFGDTPRAGLHTPGDASSESGFPFELDGNGGAGPIGPAFATPFKERMAALKSTQSEANVPQIMDERERKEKSEALKRLLSHASPLHQPHNLPKADSFYDQSSRSISTPQSIQRQIQGHNLSNPSMATQYFRPPYQNVRNSIQELEQPSRPVSSHLRHEHQPDSYLSPAELDSDPGTPPRLPPRGKKPLSFEPINDLPGRAAPPIAHLKRNKSSYSSQEMENDLRRVLKLDMT